MKNIQKVIYFILGIIVATLFFNIEIPVIAAEFEVSPNAINIIINGNSIAKTGENYSLENGTQVPFSILYNGTTYLPLRKFAEIYEKDIKWDGKTSTAYINDFDWIDPTLSSTDKKADEIRKVLTLYSPSSKYIFDNVARVRSTTSNELISEWCDDDNNFFGDMRVAVHETCHRFNSIVDNSYDEDHSLILNDSYIIDSTQNENLTVSYKYNSIMKTEEATFKIPDEYRDSSWEIYVSPNSNTASNQFGVFGLLDEFQAYYYGAKALVDSSDYLYVYSRDNGYSDELFYGYTSSLLLDKKYFYMLKYWTLEYIAYVKEYSPEQYQIIMNNTNFKTSFIDIHDKFSDLAESAIPEKIDECLEYLVTIEQPQGSIGSNNHNEIVTSLKKHLNSTEYTEIMNELRK